MRQVFWAVGLFGVSVCAVWLVLSSWTPKNGFELTLLMTFFMGAPIGNLWMLYRVIRYEKKSWPLIVMALVVPMAFLWYYIERVRPHRTSSSASQMV